MERATTSRIEAGDFSQISMVLDCRVRVLVIYLKRKLELESQSASRPTYVSRGKIRRIC